MIEKWISITAMNHYSDLIVYYSLKCDSAETAWDPAIWSDNGKGINCNGSWADSLDNTSDFLLSASVSIASLALLMWSRRVEWVICQKSRFRLLKVSDKLLSPPPLKKRGDFISIHKMLFVHRALIKPIIKMEVWFSQSGDLRFSL